MNDSLKRLFILSLSIFALLISFNHVQAEEEMAVDQADSLDLEGFHKSDKNKSKPSLIESVFGKKDKAQNTQAQASNTVDMRNRLVASSLLNVTDVNRSIQTLYMAMLKNCPEGFIKHREWTQKDVSQGAYILQFEYSCQ